MQPWCHSHKTAVWKPWCSTPYKHQHHPHFTGFWSCTTRLQSGYCQTPAQKTLLWPKCIEKVVLHQLLAHFHENNLCNPFQSAYHTVHSTETALLRVVKDNAMDKDKICFTLTGSFSCVWYFRSLGSSFMSQSCLWHPLYRSPVVLIIPSGQKSVCGCQQFYFLFISSYVWCSTGLSAGTCAICFVHYSTFTVHIIANHPVTLSHAYSAGQNSVADLLLASDPALLVSAPAMALVAGATNLSKMAAQCFLFHSFVPFMPHFKTQIDTTDTSSPPSLSVGSLTCLWHAGLFGTRLITARDWL